MQGNVGQALAESIVLRGARQGGAPLQAAQAADLLDQSLLLEGAYHTPSRCFGTCFLGQLSHSLRRLVHSV